MFQNKSSSAKHYCNIQFKTLAKATCKSIFRSSLQVSHTIINHDRNIAIKIHNCPGLKQSQVPTVIVIFNSNQITQKL
jgi:hypothetical protein